MEEKKPATFRLFNTFVLAKAKDNVKPPPAIAVPFLPVVASLFRGSLNKLLSCYFFGIAL